jgi:hypothetical protein
MKNLLLFLISFIILSCNKDDDPIPAPFVPIAINSTLVGKKNLNGSEGILQQNIIINNNTDWQNLKNQIDVQYIAIGLGNYYTENNFVDTTIDYTNYTVIAVFGQVYGNGGHTIDITNITEYNTNIVVTLENLQNGNQFSSVTQPFHIVKIPKATKPIVFQ